MVCILLFFPSLMAVYIHCRMYKIDDVLTGIYVYSIYTILINLLTCGIISIFFPSKSLAFVSSSLSVGFSIKYIALSILFSVILICVYIVYKCNWVSILGAHNIDTILRLWQTISFCFGKILFCFGEILFSLSIFLLFINIYLIENWEYLTTEEIILHVLSPLDGAGVEMVLKNIYTCILPAILIITVFNILIFVKPRNKKIIIKVKVFKKYITKTIFPFVFLKKSLLPFSVLLLIMSLIITDKNFNVKQAYRNFNNQSTFIEENYVDPKGVEITFPEIKRNLIYIYVESLETTYLSEEFGGAQSINLIPEITQIAENNIYYSSNNLFGGGMQTLVTGHTVASLVGQTSGLPLKLIGGNVRGRNKEMLPNAYTLGEILEENGYANEFIMGSDAAFAGRDSYFKSHGNYKILDYVFAKDNGIIPEDYYVWWGFEDQKLYAWAKEEALRLSNESVPFNLTLLTVDTHHVGGYVCELCTYEHPDQYANVIACASKQLHDFITWVQQQDFYENTTIIIVGDHCSMDPNFFKNLKDYNRRVLNIFINPASTPLNSKNRECSLYDMFPTTIAALGADIEGNRLGLGANLFSNEPTILEQFSPQAVMSELNKFSTFYAEKFW